MKRLSAYHPTIAQGGLQDTLTRDPGRRRLQHRSWAGRAPGIYGSVSRPAFLGRSESGHLHQPGDL